MKEDLNPMCCPDRPDDMLRHVAKLLGDLITKAVQELRASDYFDHRPENFTAGIRAAAGGYAGDLAAAFSPAVATETEGLLLKAAKRWDEEVTTSYPNGKCCSRQGACEGHPVKDRHSGGCSAPVDSESVEEDPCLCFELELRLAYALHFLLCPNAPEPSWPDIEETRA